MPPENTLVRYLLGHLPEAEADALDERSIVDGEFAERLRAVEHDLADAYVRGELNADDRRRWEERLGASRRGREDVRLATAFAARDRRTLRASRLVPRWAAGL